MYIKSNESKEIAQKQLSKNLYGYNFTCTHCGKLKINQQLINRLQQFIDDTGIELEILVGYRCNEHPDEINNLDQRSSHLNGLAVDVRTINKDFNLVEFINLADKYFNRIGVYRELDNTFWLHLDIDNTQKICWFVDKHRSKDYTFFLSIPEMFDYFDRKGDEPWTRIEELKV